MTADIAGGTLCRVLDDWCPPFDGSHLFYSGRRRVGSALRLVIDRLRYRARAASILHLSDDGQTVMNG